MLKKANNANRKQQYIGLFTSLTILISAVVGIGIFFKNKTILTMNKNNGWGVLISWILAGIIALTTALAFVETISVDKKHSGVGLAGWAAKICGHKIGRFILISLPLFYFLFKTVNTSFFTSESIFLIANNTSNSDINQFSMWSILLVAFGVILFFLIVNTLSTVAAKGISWLATVAESIPLLSIGIIGIVVGSLSKWQGNYFNDSPGPLSLTTPSAVGILASLPSILFSFDSFLAIGNAARSMKTPEKTIPKAIIIGMPIIVVAYLSVCIGQLIIGAPDVYKFFDIISDKYHINYMILRKVVGVIILMCLLGSINAFALTTIRIFNTSIEQETIFGSIVMKKICNGKKILQPGFIYSLILCTIIAVIMAIPSLLANTDAIYDLLSSLLTLFYFGIYGLVILFTLINHFTNQVEVNKQKWFVPVAIIAVIGCFFSLGYNLFYAQTIKPFFDHGASWGMFAKHGGITSPIVSLCCVAGYFIIFLAIPFANDLWIKCVWRSHKHPLIWEKVSKDYYKNNML